MRAAQEFGMNKTKTNKSANTLQALFSVLLQKRWIYAASLLLISLATLLAYIAPLVVRTTIDSLLDTIPLNNAHIVDRVFIAFGGAEVLRERIYIPALLLVGLVIIQGIFTFFSKYLASRAAEESIENLRNNLFRHIQKQSFTYFTNVTTGDIIQRSTSDVDTVRQFLQTQFVEIGNTCVMVFIALSFMFSIHVPLAVITLPVIPLTVIISYYFFKKIEKAYKESDESEGRLSAMLSEHLRSVRVVKSFKREIHEIHRFDGLNSDYRQKVQRLVDLLAMYWSISSAFTMGQIVLVLGLGSLWAVQGSVTLGTLQVFLVYVWMILWPIRQMGRILVDMGKAFVAIGRIQAVQNEMPEDIHERGTIPQLKGGISIRNLSFAYPLNEQARKENKGSRMVLDNISFDIKPGETIGILGPTGSGKTTLLHLIAGFFPNYEGNIYFDDQELRNINLHSCRRQLGYVLQEPLLFSGSIKSNIRMGHDTANFHEIRQAALLAEIHDSIQEFDMSYFTVVGERGVTLSGGQNQRLAIARAIIRNVPIYIFDDSLSALDAETDANIRDNLMNKADTFEKSTQSNYSRDAKAPTVIIVSHRLSTILGSDRIIVIENGQISQIGRHEDLISQEGLYRRLWSLHSDSQVSSEKVNQ